MNIFKTKALAWWQISLLKFCVLSFGLVVGAHFSSVILPYTTFLLTIGVVLAIYLGYIWFKK
ncbi:MAG: hypothetical protein AAB472_01745 [Patescibacteria group bacterium]